MAGTARKEGARREGKGHGSREMVEKEQRKRRE
jgi:hypothetical protein